jgi:hypothetical protein
MNKYIIVLIVIIILSTFLGFLYSNENKQVMKNYDTIESITNFSKKNSGNAIASSGNTSTFNVRYDSNKLDTQYHADFDSYKNPDLAGNIVYYQPGSFTYNSSSYVPHYEDSVFLSRKNKIIPDTFIDSTAKIGFCHFYKSQPNMIEQKCNEMNSEKCASTECCVSLGGQKCVYGNENGPIMKANYSDFLIKNKDFYYHKGNCYGNCTQGNIYISGNVNASQSSNATISTGNESNIQKCENLTKDKCNTVDYCVLLKGTSCVSGDKNGPTLKENEKPLDLNIDYYYYLNKCYGKCAG